VLVRFNYVDRMIVNANRSTSSPRDADAPSEPAAAVDASTASAGERQAGSDFPVPTFALLWQISNSSEDLILRAAARTF
jgi:hypothetical protein